MSTLNRNHACRIVKALAALMGPEHGIYIGQQGDVIAVKFGASEKVGLYVHPNRIDVVPKLVEAVGGRSAINALYPGFVSANRPAVGLRTVRTFELTLRHRRIG